MRLEKAVWTEADFKDMGWHDATVHALGFERHAADSAPTVLFDIDYIVKWVDAAPPAEHFTFWVAPATLVFTEVLHFECELSLTGDDTVQIYDLVRRLPEGEAELRYSEAVGVSPWELEEVATVWTPRGFTQHFRRHPHHSETQHLTPEERGGVGFSRPTGFD